MKRILFGLILILTVHDSYSQERKASVATVEKIEGVPVFLFATPVAEYKEVGKAVSGGYILKISIDETSTVIDKTKQLVEKALSRKKEGKVPDFDAIIIDVVKERNRAVKFKNGVSLKANVERENGVPVYFFSKPDEKYEVIAELPRDYSVFAARNLLYDKVLSSVNRILKKEESGEVGHFDAVIFNPEDFSTTLVKFK
ncbi:MAG: hypothetical protein GXO47_13215 [Chlorobi bacterium]|nr:hypothetical protein [Chlorobiota bacterium]